MLEKNQAIITLMKSIEGTTEAAGFAPVVENGSAIRENSENTIVEYAGEDGNVKLVFTGMVLEVFAKKDDGNYESIAQNLFEPDNFDNKDVKSAANEIMETIANYFDVAVVAEGDEKAKAEAKAKNAEKPAKKKKKAKKPEDRYEPINLAYRMENIFPELKGLADENEEKYGEFLADEYFEKCGSAPIIDAIRQNDKPKLKRIFKAFNTFYDEGPKDVQSLIVVSILGMNIYQDETLQKNVEGWLDNNPADTLDAVVRYLNRGLAKKKISKFQNPTPYKETRKDRRNKKISSSVDVGAIMAQNQQDMEKNSKKRK